jgi:hypothetical protein
MRDGGMTMLSLTATMFGSISRIGVVPGKGSRSWYGLLDIHDSSKVSA